jgi:Flp pilus assembly protein TadG
MNRKGAVLVLVVIAMVVFVGITALAIDIGHLVVVRNELQNAADAGALAGALALYEDPDGAGPLLPGEAVNTGANQVANDIALLNRSEKIAVEVNDPLTNIDDVQRGHWNLTTHTFTQSDSTDTFNLFGASEEDLDKMDGSFEYPPASTEYPVLVNAVRVVARRQDTPAASFFAGIFGYQGFGLSAEAVAYVGFAGGLIDAGVPLVICEESLLDVNGKPTCNIGRMINSSADPSGNNTAGWSDFDQEFSVCSGTNASKLKELVEGCGDNIKQVEPKPIAATGGTDSPVYKTMRDCWLAKTGGIAPWQMTLPTVDCVGHNIGNCPVVTGAVAVNMLWMTDIGTAFPSDAPSRMASTNQDVLPNWDYHAPPAADPNQCTAFQSQIGQPIEVALQYFADYGTDTDNPDGLAGFADPDRWQGLSTYEEGMARWDCFVNHFGLLNADGNYAPLAKKSMYFAPDCSPHEPTGATGGPNFGVLAKRPVLVM